MILPYPLYRILRPLTVGDRINVPRGKTPSSNNIGSRRKNHSQGSMLVCADGVIWNMECIQWQGNPLYEVTSCPIELLGL